MKTLMLFAVFALSFSQLSCYNDTLEIISKKGLLTARPWIVQKAEEKDPVTPWTDVFPLWAACDKDNTWRFKDDMSLEYNESFLACSPHFPNQVLDLVSWSFADNETKLIADGITYSIEQLDMNTLILFETTTIGGITSSKRISFNH